MEIISNTPIVKVLHKQHRELLTSLEKMQNQNMEK